MARTTKLMSMSVESLMKLRDDIGLLPQGCPTAKSACRSWRWWLGNIRQESCRPPPKQNEGPKSGPKIPKSK